MLRVIRNDAEDPRIKPSVRAVLKEGAAALHASALGAASIQKRLLSSRIDNPTYIEVVTASAKSRWPRYVETLDVYGDAESILSGAVSAFEYIIAQAEPVR